MMMMIIMVATTEKLLCSEYLVTLKILRRRRARSTLMPKEKPGLNVARITSKMLPTITCNTTHTDTHIGIFFSKK